MYTAVLRTPRKTVLSPSQPIAFHCDSRAVRLLPDAGALLQSGEILAHLVECGPESSYFDWLSLLHDHVSGNLLQPISGGQVQQILSWLRQYASAHIPAGRYLIVRTQDQIPYPAAGLGVTESGEVWADAALVTADYTGPLVSRYRRRQAA